MPARVERNLAVALITAGAIMITLVPARAETFWSSNNLGSGISSRPVMTELPPDQLSTYGPFASYMYDSVIPRPRNTNVRVLALAVAPAGSADGHVAACQARFRTYDIASDSYVGFDGFRHRCMLP